MNPESAKRDQYRHLARKEGYRSRASYKLLQIDKKFKILTRGDVVVDFGCAPGGWLQVVVDKISSSGFVLGLDLEEIKNINNAKTLISNVNDPNIVEIVLKNIPKRADVVLSDLSPNVSGIWMLDHFKQIEMTRKVVSTFLSILREGGKSVLKTFEGEELSIFINELKTKFSKVKISKPSASRGSSSEIYMICEDFHGKL